jgi:hypothetical protein
MSFGTGNPAEDQKQVVNPAVNGESLSYGYHDAAASFPS